MIASRRGLAVLAAIAIVLAALIALGGRAPAVGARELLPGVDLDRVTALAWGDVALVRDAAGHWQWTAPAVPADPRTVADVLAALRGARWHRAAERARAGTVHATLTVAGHAIGIADELAGSEQTWLVVADRALLVDRWVARALDPSPLALRVRAPFADVQAAHTIAAGDLVITGEPRRARGVRVAPARIAALEQALAGLALVELAPPVTAVLEIRVDDAVLHGGGACPDAPAWIAVTTSSAGSGCVTGEAWQAVRDALAPFAGPISAIADPRPAAFAVASATLPDGTLVLGGRPRIADAPADPRAVATWLAALAAPAEVVPLPTGAPAATIAITPAHGDPLVLAIYPADHVIARAGEPVALRPSPEAWAALTAPARALRDARPWLEDPTTITAIAIDTATYTRGAVIGEWQGGPAAALEALAAQLAAPTGSATAPPPFAVVHRVRFTVATPGAPPVDHVAELGAPTAAGCPVRFASDAQLVPPALCAAVAAVLSR